MGDLFTNVIVEATVTPAQLAALAAGHRGVVKVVVDVRRRRMAAGGEWHTDCLALLKNSGSSPDDCWGAKLDTATGGIVYKSQINQNRPDNRLDEIADPAIREQVLAMIELMLTPAMGEF